MIGKRVRWIASIKGARVEKAAAVAVRSNGNDRSKINELSTTRFPSSWMRCVGEGDAAHALIVTRDNKKREPKIKREATKGNFSALTKDIIDHIVSCVCTYFWRPHRKVIIRSSSSQHRCVMAKKVRV